MTDFIYLLLINVGWIWGINCLFSKGYALYEPGKFIENIIGTTWVKPLFACPPCQSSFHGLLFSFWFYGLSLVVFPYLVCLCGINYIIKEYLYP